MYYNILPGIIKDQNFYVEITLSSNWWYVKVQMGLNFNSTKKLSMVLYSFLPKQHDNVAIKSLFCHWTTWILIRLGGGVADLRGWVGAWKWWNAGVTGVDISVSPQTCPHTHEYLGVIL